MNILFLIFSISNLFLSNSLEETTVLFNETTQPFMYETSNIELIITEQSTEQSTETTTEIYYVNSYNNLLYSTNYIYLLYLANYVV